MRVYHDSATVGACLKHMIKALDALLQRPLQVVHACRARACEVILDQEQRLLLQVAHNTHLWCVMRYVRDVV